MLCSKRAGWGVLDKDPNPASATHNGIASCKATSYVVFCFRLRQICAKKFQVIRPTSLMVLRLPWLFD